MGSEAASRVPRLPIYTGVLVASIVVIIMIWDWNWFRPLIQRQASRSLGREVTLKHFDVLLSRKPVLILDGLRIGNPEGFEAGSAIATVETLKVQLDAPALWRRKLSLLHIDIAKVEGELFTNAKGQGNWKFLLPESEGESAFETELGRLSISDSHVRFRDPSLKADVDVRFATLPGRTGTEDSLRADFDGKYNGEKLSGHFLGGALLGLREPKNPYPVELRLKHGGTSLSVDGNVLNPVKLGGANLRLTVQGKNMEQLYALTGIPFPQTPPYELKSAVAYEQSNIRLTGITGALGSSDIAGNVAIALKGEKPVLVGSLRSKKVNLGDLAGFIGAKPAGQPESALQAASGRLLPVDPISVPKLNAADIDIRYEATEIRGESMPLDDISAHLVLKNGRYSLQPLDFKVGKGEISTRVTLDGSQSVPSIDAAIKFLNVDTSQLLAASSLKGGGNLGGRVTIKSSGVSPSEMMARGNGEAQLFMQGGDVSALFVSLAGLDLGSSAISLLGLPSRTELRCFVGDVSLKDGLLETRSVLADTKLSNLRLNGALNFKDESLDFRLHTEEKRFSIGSLSAPIKITGRLKNPSVLPDFKKLGGKAALAAAAGFLATPLAALIPTIELGLGKDNDCQAMISEAAQDAATQKVAAPKPAKKKRRTRR